MCAYNIYILDTTLHRSMIAAYPGHEAKYTTLLLQCGNVTMARRVCALESSSLETAIAILLQSLKYIHSYLVSENY